MQAHPVLLQMKYARIIALIAKQQNIGILAALNLFYTSETYQLMRQGIGDMHCRSDLYLVDEIVSPS